MRNTTKSSDVLLNRSEGIHMILKLLFTDTAGPLRAYARVGTINKTQKQTKNIKKQKTTNTQINTVYS